jgi:hypothetical protein
MCDFILIFSFLFLFQLASLEQDHQHAVVNNGQQCTSSFLFSKLPTLKSSQLSSINPNNQQEEHHLSNVTQNVYEYQWAKFPVKPNYQFQQVHTSPEKLPHSSLP